MNLYDLGVRTIIDFRSDSEREVDNYVCDPRFTRHNWCCLMPETGINDFYFPRLVTKQSSDGGNNWFIFFYCQWI
ncbi:MAG: hypothetical protein ACLTTH_10125 [Holdemanella porci]